METGRNAPQPDPGRPAQGPPDEDAPPRGGYGEGAGTALARMREEEKRRQRRRNEESEDAGSPEGEP